MSYNIIKDDERKMKRLSAETEALKAKKEKDWDKASLTTKRTILVEKMKKHL